MDSAASSGKRAKLYIIPPRPDTLVELTRQMQSGEPDLEAITAILKQDVSLYTTVLACVNTPAFGLGRTITSLTHAVMLMGYQKLHNVIRLAILKQSLSKAGSLERFWDSATEIANIMLLLARRFDMPDREAAYAVGMLHDCGIPLMMESHADYRDFLRSLKAADLVSCYKQEKRTYNHDHFTLGYEIAKRWMMPEAVCLAIKYQPAYAKLLNSHCQFPEEVRNLIALLLLAKDISREYRHYWRIESAQEDVNDLKPVFHALGISDYDYKDIQEDCLTLLDTSN